MSSNEPPKNKATAFLERNEIWFKTVLSLAVTIAALFVSMASCSNSRYQAQLTAANASRENREKAPFFSIEQYYDKERGQFLYGIVNTGGKIRQCDIELHPYLVIEQRKIKNQNVSESPLDQPSGERDIQSAFIYLPEFYTPEDPATFENGILAFSDVWVDVNSLPDFAEVQDDSSQDEQKLELANDYFEFLVSWNNTDDLPTRMGSAIEYYIVIHYYNYENHYQTDTLWLSRRSDLTSRSVGVRGNSNLSLRRLNADNEQYKEASKNNHTYIVDSLNLSQKDIASECIKIIEELFVEFGQIRDQS